MTKYGVECRVDSLRGFVGAGSVGNMTSIRADWVRLTEWLAERTEPVVVIGWSELDAIVGGLPESATKHYPQWWHGDRPNTRAWRRAGYEFVQVDVGRTVTLRKSTAAETRETDPTATRPSVPQPVDNGLHEDSDSELLQTIDPRSALILLPCSGDKALGGIHRAAAPFPSSARRLAASASAACFFFSFAHILPTIGVNRGGFQTFTQ